MNKIYCFVDETGQDTAGRLFIVVIIVIKNLFIDEIREGLSEIEKITGKHKSKWGKAKHEIRSRYIKSTIKLIKKSGHVYYASFFQTKEYVALTAFTLAQAILMYSDKLPMESTIIIDGLKSSEQEKVSRLMKIFNIKYAKIRGARDESEPVLRLADSIAGLVRDAEEKNDVSQKLLSLIKSYDVITKIQK
ncbi:MAG: DUF3800 domain-containing protein [Candidatus Amesbacteria bacterium]|nr:DUF3800 domain-containing protein [Candidatus Amesbacteria bacterium]